MAINNGDRKVLSTTYGEVYINGEKVQELVSGEVKIAAEYVDVDIAGDLDNHRKLSKKTITGTITVNKINSRFTKLMIEAVNNGYAPEINMQLMLAENNVFEGSEVILLKEVTFDEITLFKSEKGGTFTQELPFGAAGIKALEYME